MNKKLTIEWAPFQLADGVDEATLLAASEGLQKEFLGKQDGFIRRDLVRVSDGQWADIVYWDSREAAELAARNVGDSPVCFRYFELMVGEDAHDAGAGVSHFEVVKTYA